MQVSYKKNPQMNTEANLILYVCCVIFTTRLLTIRTNLGSLVCKPLLITYPIHIILGQCHRKNLDL